MSPETTHMWSTGGQTSSPTSMYGSPKPGDSVMQERCRFFLNGGCLRGDACPYSHDLPDERHLDVNGVGFIFTSGVQNSGSALQRRYQPQGSPAQPAPGAPQPPAYQHAAAIAAAA